MESSLAKLIKSPGYAPFLKKLILMSVPVLLIGLFIKNEMMIEVGGGTFVFSVLLAIPAIIYRRKQMDSEGDYDNSKNQ